MYVECKCICDIFICKIYISRWFLTDQSFFGCTYDRAWCIYVSNVLFGYKLSAKGNFDKTKMIVNLNVVKLAASKNVMCLSIYTYV